MQRFTPEEVGFSSEQMKDFSCRAAWHEHAVSAHRAGEFTIVDCKSHWQVFKLGVYLSTMSWSGHKGTPVNVPCVPQKQFMATLAELKALGIVPSTEKQFRSAGLSLSLAQMLELMVINGERLELPTDVTFEKSSYQALKVAMKNAGATYSDSGFAFEHSLAATTTLGRLLDGESINLRKSLQFYPTTDVAADKLLDGLDLNGKRVFEPNAGEAYLVRRAYEAGAANVVAAEIYDGFHDAIVKSGANLIGTDLLALTGEDISHHDIDVCIMNPPFSGGQDIKHVEHVLSIVSDRTEVRAIMSAGVLERSGGAYERFRAYLSSMSIEPEILPAGAFKESGTMVRTCVVRIPPRVAQLALAV